MKLNDLLTSQALSEDGVWLSYPHLPSFRVKIGSAQAAAYSEFLRDGYLELRQELSLEDSDDIAADHPRSIELVREALARTCVRDWEGLDDFPYSEENAVKLLANPEAEAIAAWVLTQSFRLSNFRKSLEDETEKKS